MKMKLQKYGGAVLAILTITGGALAQGPSGYQPNSGMSESSAAPSRPPSSQTNPFLGSVPSGTATAENLPLSLADAIQRGLRQNLGLLLGNDAVVASQGELWKERSKLLPNISAGLSETESQVNLAALGIKFPGVPTIVGPFAYMDARARMTTSLLDFHDLDTNRAAAHNLAAEKLTYQDSRETVVLVVAGTYLQVIAGQARVS